MTQALCEASFARSHRFVPDFLVSILPKPAIFFFFVWTQFYLLNCFSLCTLAQCILSFLWKSATTLNFGLFSVLLAVACHCATFLPVGEGEQ